MQQSSVAASQDWVLKPSSAVQKVPQLQLPLQSGASPSLVAQVRQEPAAEQSYLDLADGLVRLAISKAAAPLGLRRRRCCSACALRAWQAWTAAKRLRATTAEQLFLQRSRFQAQQLSGRSKPLQLASLAPSPQPLVIAEACWRAWRTQARAAVARLLPRCRVAQMAVAHAQLASAGVAAQCWVAWRRLVEAAGHQRRRAKEAQWTQCRRQLLQPALRGWSLWVLASKADAQVKAEAAACADECLAAEVRLDQAVQQHAKQTLAYALARQGMSEKLFRAEDFALLTSAVDSWRLQAALLRAGRHAEKSQKEAVAAATAQCELEEQERFRQLQEIHDAEQNQLQEKHSLELDAAAAREAELVRESSDKRLEINRLQEEMQRMREMQQMQREELLRWQHQTLEGNRDRRQLEQQLEEQTRRSLEEHQQLQQTLEEQRQKNMEERQQLEHCLEEKQRQQNIEKEQQLEHVLQGQQQEYAQLREQHRLQASEQRKSRCLGWARRWSSRAAAEEAEIVQVVLRSWGALAGKCWRWHSAALERSAACDRGLLGWALTRACWALWTGCVAEVRRVSFAEQRAKCLLRPAQRRALQCAIQAAVALRREKQAIVFLQAWRRTVREAEVRKWRAEVKAKGDKELRWRQVVQACLVSWCCQAARSLARRASQRAASAEAELLGPYGHQQQLLLRLILQTWQLLRLDSQYLQIRDKAQAAEEFETRAQHAYKNVQNCFQLQRVKLTSLQELLGVALAGAQEKSLKSLVFAALARHAAARRREAARVNSKEMQVQLQVQLERQRSEFRKAAEEAAGRLIRGQQRHQSSMASLGSIMCSQKHMSLLLSVWGRWRCLACGQAAAAAAQQLEILEGRCEELVQRLDWENSRWQQLDEAAEAQGCQEASVLVEPGQLPMLNIAEIEVKQDDHVQNASQDAVPKCAEDDSQPVLEADECCSGIAGAAQEAFPEENWLDFSVPLCSNEAIQSPSPQSEERSTYPSGVASPDKDKLHDVLQEVHQVQLELRAKGWLEPSSQQLLTPSSPCCTPTSSYHQGIIDEEIPCADSSMQMELELAWSSQLGTRRCPGTPEDAEGGPSSPWSPNEFALVEQPASQAWQDGEPADAVGEDTLEYSASSPKITFEAAEEKEEVFVETYSPLPKPKEPSTAATTTKQQEQIFERINQSLASALADLAPQARHGDPLCPLDVGPPKPSNREDENCARFSGAYGQEEVDGPMPGRFCFPGFEALPPHVEAGEQEAAPCRRASAVKDHRSNVGRSSPRSISEGLAHLRSVTSSLMQKSAQ